VLKKADLPPGVLESTRDPWGRVVHLREDAMRHIEKGHPELAGCDVAITTAVENAACRCRGKQRGREVLYAENLGPAEWIAIVVAFDRRVGEVITAYGSKRGPRSSDRI